MKSFAVFVVLYLALSLLACQDTNEPVKRPHQDYIAYRSIGEQIPFETGMKWIEAYREQEGLKDQEGRTSLISLAYQITAPNLQLLTGSVTDLTGVAFHYALDGSGVKHILIIPVDESLSLWINLPGRVIIDANTDTEISHATAQAWAQNYKNAHPFGIWFHFFGADIFDEIAAIPFFTTLDIQPGLNILNLIPPQMLLIVWNLPIIGGRTRENEGIVFDASNPCPPCAVE